jgi:hypothetical protein
MLNLSHCLLKLGRAGEAAAEAGAVIALDKRSLKGYYRRYDSADMACALRACVRVLMCHVCLCA